MELTRIEAEIRACTACVLHRGRANAVPGEGPHNAQILFIGEAPGFHEDQQGRPFVGASGKFLEEMLNGIGLARAQVYITNVVKCRPPANRDPLEDEISACSGYLDRQIALIRPRLIVTLGRFSMARFFPNARISQIHGQPRQVSGLVCYPLYHPAAALHQPSLRRVVEEDFQRIPAILNQTEGIDEYEPPPQIQQMRLF